MVGMSNLVVLTFDNETDARDALKSLREMEKMGQVSIEDTAVVVKDRSGKVKVDNEVSGAVETGAVVGGTLGLMISFLFPVAGIAIGLGGGALVAKLMETGVDGNFVKDLSNELQPGTSALFIVGRGSNHAVVLRALEPFKGTVYQTTLDPDLENELKRVLR